MTAFFLSDSEYVLTHDGDVKSGASHMVSVLTLENTCRMSQKIGKKFVHLNNSLDWILNGSNDENTEFDDLLSL